jgi:hypothetical protein
MSYVVSGYAITLVGILGYVASLWWRGRRG